MDNIVRIFCREANLLEDKRGWGSTDWKILFLRNKLDENNKSVFRLCEQYGELDLNLFDSKTIFQVHPTLGTKLKIKYFSIDHKDDTIVPIEESLLDSLYKL